MSKARWSWRDLLPVAAVLALALLLRWLPLEHGFPRNYLPDTHAVRAALGMAKDKDLAPPVGKYSTYPYLMPYLLLPAYAAQYALGKADGRWADAAEFGARIADHPERAAKPARALVACFGALTALAVYAAARAAGLRRGALAAMFLAATGLLHVQMSVQERPWVLVVFFGALCLWACVEYAGTRRSRALVLAGACAGLAFAAHQAGLFFALLVASTWAFATSGEDDWRGRRLARRVGLALGAAAACLVVGVACGHAYYLVHGAVDQQGVAGGAAAAEHLSIGGQALRVGLSWDSFTRLGRALCGYDPVLVCLALPGALLAWRSRPMRGPLCFTALYAAFFLFNPSDHVRYLLPLTVLLALPAGVACERVLERAGPGHAGRLAVAALLALPLVQSARLVWLLRQQDTRAEAELRLAALEDPRARVAIDHYGPQVDLSRESLEELARLRPLRTREERRLALLSGDGASEVRPGVHAVFLEELFGFDAATATYGVDPERRAIGATPAAVLDALAITHVLLVNRRPARRDEPPLAALAAGWTPEWTIDPSRPRRLAPEAFLPTEMDFPLTGLWRVERPGPWMALYALPPR